MHEFGFEGAASTHEQHISNEVEQTCIEFRPFALGFVDCSGDFLAIFIRDLVPLRNYVRSVDSKSGANFANRPPDFSARKITAIAVVFADFDEKAGEAVHVAAKGFQLDVELLVVGYCGKIGWLVCKFRVNLRHLFQPIRVRKPAVAKIQEVIAACALDRPILTKRFSRFEDLFANDPSIGALLAQAREVLQWIAQTVGMVHAHSVENALVNPIEDAAMGGIEDVWSLNAQSNKGIHIKKSAIPELLVRG